MSIDLEIPNVGESVTEALISKWLKSEGDWVDKDEPVVELETDKVTVELPAPVAGVLGKLLKDEGETAEVGEKIGSIDDEAERPEQEAGQSEGEEQEQKEEGEETEPGQQREEEEAVKPAEERKERREEPTEEPRVMPAARRALAEHGLDEKEVEASGPGGRLLKEDVERAARQRSTDQEDRQRAPEETPLQEEVVAMSPIRRRIAERLVAAQQEAALLTTFNEVDMSQIMRLRREYRDDFEKRHGVRLGFMSFFVKATIDALRQFPQLNAEVRGTDIVYRNRYDIGIAVSTDRGLLVPVLRGAERLSFSEIEKEINDFATRARSNKIKLHELEGGTFTITNGGVFGSMLSTPIVNPPQSGVLGLHAIEERPVAVNGEVEVHPMMYIALTYDHRIVDGREAVTFLRRIKEAVADPSRLLLEV